MPHLIVSTVALLSNLYKNAPLIVGDKDSDPDLMRFLGARITTNYPACGSPPMYVMHAPPRTVFDNLEKRGYCLMSAQTIQEHSVWILARPRVPDDDKVEISRGGPNDKSVQAFEDTASSSTVPPRTPSTSRSRSPAPTSPRITITRSSSKQTLNEENKTPTVKAQSAQLTVEKHPALIREGSVNQKSLLIGDQALRLSYEKSDSLAVEESSIGKSSEIENQSHTGDSSVGQKISEGLISMSKSQLVGLQVKEISQSVVQTEVEKLVSNIISQLFDSEFQLPQKPYSVVMEILSAERPFELEQQISIVEQLAENQKVLEIPALREGDTRPASPDKRNRDTSPSSVTLSVQIRDSSPRRKSSHIVKKIGENQKLSFEILENEPRRRTPHRSRKILESEDAHSRSVSPDKRAIRDLSPNSQSLTIQVPENFPTLISSQKDKINSFPNNLTLSVQVRDNSPIRKSAMVKEKASFEIETTSSPSASSAKRHTSPGGSNKERDYLQQVQKQKTQEEIGPSRIRFDFVPSHSRSSSPMKRYNTEQDTHTMRRILEKDKKRSLGQEDSLNSLVYNKKDAGNVTSRGDAGTYWSKGEKVHMGIQASNSEVSLKKNSDIMSRVAFNARKHSELLKNSDELLKNPSEYGTPKIKSALKRTLSSSEQTQASISSEVLMKPRISVRFANSNDELVLEKPSVSEYELPRVPDPPGEGSGPYIPPEADLGSHFLDFEESALMKEARVLKDSVILKSLASRCSHITIVGDADRPMFIDITDPNHLTCLTQETCCCEEN